MHAVLLISYASGVLKLNVQDLRDLGQKTRKITPAVLYILNLPCIAFTSYTVAEVRGL